MSTLARKCPVLLIAANDRSGKLAESIRRALEAVAGLRLEVVASRGEAVAAIQLADPALVLVHLAESADAAWAVSLLPHTAALGRPVGTVVIGESGLAEAGLALLRRGAVDYLERPLDLRRLALLVDVLTVRARQQMAQEPGIAEPLPECAFLDSPSSLMGRVMDQARRVAGVDSNILILGETGTGKTRLARIIHDLSPRSGQPFLVVNCAALSPTLIESEMFGHVKGAFTGAERNRTGKFADAAEGTIFLDEVDSLPPELQAKLLRVVGDRVFEQVGSNTPQPMRARLIAASNRSLSDEVEGGRFRSDLYFRLNVVTLEMPPLRERPEVFEPMVAHFLKEMAGQAGRRITGIAPEAASALRAYRWPGNVRELRNAIERAVALRTEGRIELDDLPDAIRTSSEMARTVESAALTATLEMSALGAGAIKPTPSLAGTRAETEAALIRSVLRKNNNNRARTAAELGISRETLYKKLHRYNLFGSQG